MKAITKIKIYKIYCRPLKYIKLLPVKIQKGKKKFSFHFNLLNLVEGRDLFDCHVDHP